MMNEYVRMSVDGRKNAVYSAYDIQDEELKRKIEDLFSRIEAFGEGYQDASDFEAQFAASELNQEYISLFTEIATKCTLIVREEQNPDAQSTGEYVADEIKDEIDYQVKEMTMPARRIARQQAYDTARRTPVVGEIMQAKQTADLFGGIFRLRKAKKEQKEREKEEKERDKDNNNEV